MGRNFLRKRKGKRGDEAGTIKEIPVQNFWSSNSSLLAVFKCDIGRGRGGGGKRERGGEDHGVHPLKRWKRNNGGFQSGSRRKVFFSSLSPSFPFPPRVLSPSSGAGMR